MTRLLAISAAVLVIVILIGVAAMGLHTFTDTPEDLFTQGYQAYQQGDLATAIADYTKSIQMNADPADSVAAYCKRGQAHMDLGEIDLAAADFDSAINIDPKYAEAYSMRGLAREDKEDYKGALEDFNNAAKLDTHNVEPFLYRAYLYYMAGKYSDCSQTLTNIFNMGRLTGDDLDSAWFFFWLSRANSGDKDAATTDLANFLATRQNPADFNARVGRFLLGKINEGEMIQAAGDPDTPKDLEQIATAQFYAANVRLLAGNKEGAKEMLQKVVDSNITHLPEFQVSKVMLKHL